jgi:TetR/AcrR family transcriptional repressor of nem operon
MRGNAGSKMSKGAMTRQRIIEEAAPIFNQRGFAGCSLAELMTATGLEKGGIYRHFASKEELAVEAFRYALAQSVKVKTEKLEGIEGAVEKLRHVVRRFVATPSNVAGGCPLMNTAIDADDGNPALRAAALQGIQDWRGRLARIAEGGLVLGEIQEGTDPKRVANNIMAALEGALMIARLEGTRQALTDAGMMLEEMLDRLRE